MQFDQILNVLYDLGADRLERYREIVRQQEEEKEEIELVVLVDCL